VGARPRPGFHQQQVRDHRSPPRKGQHHPPGRDEQKPRKPKSYTIIGPRGTTPREKNRAAHFLPPRSGQSPRLHGANHDQSSPGDLAAPEDGKISLLRKPGRRSHSSVIGQVDVSTRGGLQLGDLAIGSDAWKLKGSDPRLTTLRFFFFFFFFGFESFTLSSGMVLASHATTPREETSPKTRRRSFPWISSRMFPDGGAHLHITTGMFCAKPGAGRLGILGLRHLTDTTSPTPFSGVVKYGDNRPP